MLLLQSHGRLGSRRPRLVPLRSSKLIGHPVHVGFSQHDRPGDDTVRKIKQASAIDASLTAIHCPELYLAHERDVHETLLHN